MVKRNSMGLVASLAISALVAIACEKPQESKLEQEVTLLPVETTRVESQRIQHTIRRINPVYPPREEVHKGMEEEGWEFDTNWLGTSLTFYSIDVRGHFVSFDPLGPDQEGYAIMRNLESQGYETTWRPVAYHGDTLQEQTISIWKRKKSQ